MRTRRTRRIATSAATSGAHASRKTLTTAVAVALVVGVLAACSSSSKTTKASGRSAAAIAALQSAVSQSAASPPRYTHGAITPGPGNSVTVAVSVAYPAVSKGPSAQTITLHIWDSPAANTALATSVQHSDVAPGRTGTYRFTVNGAAAARLRSAGVGAPQPSGGVNPADLVTVTVDDNRNLDNQSGPDHVWEVSASGASLVDAGAKASGPTPVSFTVTWAPTCGNQCPQAISDPVTLSAAALQCIQNAGSTGVAALNGVELGGVDPKTHNPGLISKSVSILADQGDVQDPVAARLAEDVVPTLESQEVRSVVTQYANAFQVGALVATGASIPTYASFIGALESNSPTSQNGPLLVSGQSPVASPPSAPAAGSSPPWACTGQGGAKQAFVLGVDGRAFGAHREAMFTSPGGTSQPFAEADLGPNVAQGLTFDTSQLNAGQLKVLPQPFASGGYDPAAPQAKVGGVCQPWNWMTCVYTPGQADEVRLMDVLWPGTHDSGTALLDASPWYRDNPENVGVNDDTNCAARRIVDPWLGAAGVQRWAVAQRLTLRQQLDAGVRYLDIRAVWDNGHGTGDLTDPGAKHVPRWTIGHTSLSAEDLKAALATVTDWAAAHPQEVVIVQFGVCDQYRQPGKDEKGPQSTYPDIGTLENAVLVPTLCSRSYHWDGDIHLGNKTLSQLRSAKTNVVTVLPGAPWDSTFLKACDPVVNNSQNSIIGMQSAEFPLTPSMDQKNADSSICANRDTATRANTDIINTFLNVGQYGYTANNYKLTGPIPNRGGGATMGLNGIHYEGPTGAMDSIGFYKSPSCPHSLLELGKALMPSHAPEPNRDQIVDQVNCDNILTVDDFNQDDYDADPLSPSTHLLVDHFIPLNSWGGPTAPRPCVNAPDDVFLHFTLTVPSGTSTSMTLSNPSGTIDPAVPITATPTSGGPTTCTANTTPQCTVSTQNGDSTLTIANTSATTWTGTLTAAAAYPAVPPSLGLTIGAVAHGVHGSVRAGEATTVPLSGLGLVVAPVNQPGGFATPPGPLLVVPTSSGTSVFHIVSDGTLQPVGAQVATWGGGPMVASHDGRFVYQGGGAGLTQFAIANGVPGASVQLTAASVSAVATTPDGSSVYAVLASGNIQQYSVGPNGWLAAKSPPSVTSAANQAGAVVSHDGKNLYVTNQGANSVSHFRIGSGGVLTAAETLATAGQSPTVLTLSPDGASLYVAGTAPSATQPGMSQFDVHSDGTLAAKDPAGLPGPGVQNIPTTIIATPEGSVFVGVETAGLFRYDIGSGGALTPVNGGINPAELTTVSVIVPGTSPSIWYQVNPVGNTIMAMRSVQYGFRPLAAQYPVDGPHPFFAVVIPGSP